MELPRRSLFTTRSLILLTIPIIAESLLTQLVGMVDGVMVSSVGEVAISAVSLVNNVSAVIINLLTALAGGGSIVTSQLIGANKTKEAKRSTGQVITMTFMTATIIGMLSLIFSRPLLKLIFGQVEQAVMDDAVTYLFYDALSYPLLALCAAAGAIQRSKGETKTMLYVSLLRNAVNIAGNAICIYGFKMGVAGVAIPTALSRLIGAAILMPLVMRKSTPLRPDPKDIFHINPRLMRKMLRVGLPTAVENSMFQLGRLLTLSMISGFGTVHIAANSTSGALTGLVVIFSGAVRLAAMNVIGQCVGTGDEKQIKLNFRRLLIMCYIAHCTAAIIAILLRYPLVGLYTGLSAETAELTVELMLIHLIPSLLLYTPSFFIAVPLRAANDSAYCMVISILSMIIFRLTLAQILCVNMGMGAKGVYFAMVTDWVCRSICFIVRWYCGAWKKKCGLSPKKQPA